MLPVVALPCKWRGWWMLSMFCLVFTGGSDAVFGGETSRTVVTEDDVELEVTVYPGSTEHVVIWLPSRAGISDREQEVGARLAEKGPHVWLADLLADRFLVGTRADLAAIPASDVAALVEAAADEGLKPVLVTGGYGAGVALRGAAAAREAGHDVSGLILMYPYVYEEIPDFGEEPEFLPEVEKADGSIVILQPTQSTQSVWVEDVADALREAGAEVTVRHLEGVRDAFQERRSETEADIEGVERLPEWLVEALEELGAGGDKKREAKVKDEK